MTCTTNYLEHKFEQILRLLEKVAGRVIIITLALVECYKYVRWLLEHSSVAGADLEAFSVAEPAY